MNFDILTTELPIFFLGGLFALGLAFPVLAAWSPIVRWTNVSVTDALQHCGANPNDGYGARFDARFDARFAARFGARFAAH